MQAGPGRGNWFCLFAFFVHGLRLSHLYAISNCALKCRLIWTQVHSRDRNQMRLGVKAADQLLTLKAEESQQLLYLAAVGEYKLGKLTEARTRLKAALQGNKDFSQGKNLLKAIDDKLTSDTIVAGGVVAAVVGVSVTLAGVLLAGGSGKRR